MVTLDGFPGAVVGRILSFLELRWLLSFRLLCKSLRRVITETDEFKARWLDILRKAGGLDVLYNKAVRSFQADLTPADFAIKFGLETARWRRRAFTSSSVLPLPESIQHAATKSQPAIRDAHRLFSKALIDTPLADVRERALLASVLGQPCQTAVPLVMEERPLRNGRLHVIWPGLITSMNSTQTYRFGKTLGLLPPAASAAIESPLPVTFPEISWIVDPKTRRVLVNWSAVYMETSSHIHCRISVHVIDPSSNGPVSLPPSTQMFCFPLSTSSSSKAVVVTALAGIVINNEMLVAIGTSEGYVLVAVGPDQDGVIEKVKYTVSRGAERNNRPVKTITLNKTEEGKVQLFVTSDQAMQLFQLERKSKKQNDHNDHHGDHHDVQGGHPGDHHDDHGDHHDDHDASSWRLIVQCLTTTDHPNDFIKFISGGNELCVSVPSSTKPLAILDLRALRKLQQPQALDLGTFVIYAGRIGQASFQDPDSCLWFMPYRVTKKPEFIEYIASLDLWVIALDHTLRLLKSENGSAKLVTILNSPEKIYFGRGDGMYRFASVDITETVTIWDLRRRCKLMQFDLLEYPDEDESSEDDNDDDTPTRTSYTVIDSPIISPSRIILHEKDHFPALPSPSIPIKSLPKKSSVWGGANTRDIIKLDGPQISTRLYDGPEGTLTPMDSPIQKAARSYADRSQPSELEIATEEYGRQLGLNHSELELYHQSLLLLDNQKSPSSQNDEDNIRSIQEANLSPTNLGDLAREDQIPVPRWIQEQRDELESLSAKKSSSSKNTEILPMETVLAHKLHNTGRAPANMVIEPIDVGSGSHRKISKVQSLGHLMKRKQKNRLLLDEDAQQAFKSSTGELFLRLGSKRAVAEISLGPTHLALYFGSLATWQTWRM